MGGAGGLRGVWGGVEVNIGDPRGELGCWERSQVVPRIPLGWIWGVEGGS